MSRADHCKECGALPHEMCMDGSGRRKEKDHAKRDQAHLRTIAKKASVYARNHRIAKLRSA